MSLYSIGEVARICGINPVTLRAWQRRYGLLKPQRTEGGHRLFGDQDLDTIRVILSWINRGVPVGQVKALLEGKVEPLPNSWSQSEHRLLDALQNNNMQKVRQLLSELGRDYPANALVNNVLRPLRSRLSSGGPSLMLLRNLLDGILIEHTVMCLNAARKKPGVRVVLLGWGPMDNTELWLEAIIRSEEGVQIDVLPQPLDEPYLDNISAHQILLWSEGRLTRLQKNKMIQWREQGLSVGLLGSAALLTESDPRQGDNHDL
ncbi:MerR family transcriptional regulator [Ewingella americana]|uniref:MerR family transcriptional regulator n=1 Tax=Ewingella americana TaxID=41202 RepID=A0A502GQP4_9GAMM|nr:MerR family transcriptional regulator [Ewingella americana]TPG63842.1 MerR family transcriptional regulator [Ewingella americana]